MSKLQLALLCLALSIQGGICLKCYVCDSSDAKISKCADAFQSTAYPMETCDTPSNVCFKVQLPPDEKTYKELEISSVIRRHCGDKDYCSVVAGKAHFCAVCSDKDGCNSSSMMVPSFIASVVFLLTYYF